MTTLVLTDWAGFDREISRAASDQVDPATENKSSTCRALHVEQTRASTFGPAIRLLSRRPELWSRASAQVQSGPKVDGQLASVQLWGRGRCQAPAWAP